MLSNSVVLKVSSEKVIVRLWRLVLSFCVIYAAVAMATRYRVLWLYWRW